MKYKRCQPNCKEHTHIVTLSDPGPITTPMGWIQSFIHEKTRTIEEVAHFAGPNAGREFS